MTDTAFHVTPKENLASIAAHGLIAHKGERSEQLNEPPGVFLFPSRKDCDTALSQWLGDEFEHIEEDGLVILEVEMDSVDGVWTAPFEIMSKKGIPANSIVRVYAEDWSVVCQGLPDTVV